MIFNIAAVGAVLLTAIYLYFIFLYTKWWKRLPFFPAPPTAEPTRVSDKRLEANPSSASQKPLFISVLIPARNEADNIGACLRSILAGTYPKTNFEIIVIDDHSEDETPQYVRDFAIKNPHVRLIELKDYVKLADNQPFKKRAIEAAIGEAKGELIVTTDGDCLAPKDWLSLIALFYQQTGKRFIAAPVNFYDEKTALERFQSLDYIGMMGITGAGVAGRFMNMCNGANLAYQKDLFYEVGGFRGIDHVASGDDMLLMQKVAKRQPEALGYLKNPAATVLTKAKPDLAAFFSQRQRWATKSSSYTEFFTVFQLAVVFLFCWGIILSFCLSIIYDGRFIWLFLFSFSAKTVADYFFLRQMVQFFNREDLLHPYLSPQLGHILYIVAVGTLSNFKKTYRWKGRVVR